MFRHLTQNENNLPASTVKVSIIEDSDVPPVPKKTVSTTSNSPLMSGFLKNQEADETTWLTGVKGSEQSTNSSSKNSSKSQKNKQDSLLQGEKQKDTSKVSNAKEDQKIVEKLEDEELFPPLPEPATKTNEENTVNFFKEATITPPPEEKVAAQAGNNNNKSSMTSSKKTQSTNNKKVRRNKDKKALGQISPTSSSDSGQEQTSIKHSGSTIHSS
jgi:hypothetical protein